MKVTFAGNEWSATLVEEDGEYHLMRTCTGCYATGAGYNGMWNPRKHVVEMVLPVAVVEITDARIARLDAAGEVEAAATVREMAFRIVK